jgi:hypothetical protein
VPENKHTFNKTNSGDAIRYMIKLKKQWESSDKGKGWGLNKD